MDCIGEGLQKSFPNRQRSTEGSYPYQYQIDLGSIIQFLIPAPDFEYITNDLLAKIDSICRWNWQWSNGDQAVNEDGQILDMRRVLYFNFASPDDAMLVRMSISDLQKVKYADGGGLP